MYGSGNWVHYRSCLTYDEIVDVIDIPFFICETWKMHLFMCVSSCLTVIVINNKSLSMTNFRNEDLAVLYVCSELWLATRVGKMGLSCPHGITCCVFEGKSVVFEHKKSCIDKHVWSRWLDIGHNCFLCGCVYFNSISVHKKRTWAISSHLYPICLVNKLLACLRLYHFSLLQDGSLYIEVKQREFSKIEWDKFCWTVFS